VSNYCCYWFVVVYFKMCSTDLIFHSNGCLVLSPVIMDSNHFWDPYLPESMVVLYNQNLEILLPTVFTHIWAALIFYGRKWFFLFLEGPTSCICPTFTCCKVCLANTADLKVFEHAKESGKACHWKTSERLYKSEVLWNSPCPAVISRFLKGLIFSEV
jgi:hypothetical protein